MQEIPNTLPKSSAVVFNATLYFAVLLVLVGLVLALRHHYTSYTVPATPTLAATAEASKLFLFAKSGEKLAANKGAILEEYRKYGVTSITLTSQQSRIFLSTAIVEMNKQRFKVPFILPVGFDRGVKEIKLGEGTPVVRVENLPQTATAADEFQEELERTIETSYPRLQRAMRDIRYMQTGEF